MENLNYYAGRAKDAHLKTELLGLWRYVTALLLLLCLINVNSYAGGETRPPCLAPCDDLRTQTMGGWGATPKGNNPAKDLADNFARISPIVVGNTSCGKGFTLTLTSADAVNRFLPSGSTSRALDKNYLNPTNTSEKKNGYPIYENVLAGQAVALTISIAMENAVQGTNRLANAYVNASLFGENLWTVAEVLAEANRILSGCLSAYTPSQINSVLSQINESHVDGIRKGDTLLCPSEDAPRVRLDADEECNGPTTITATVEGGNGPYTYRWFDIDNNVINVPSDRNYIEVTVAGTYKVKVKDKYGCKGEAEITVEVWENPIVSLEADEECDGPTTITASASGGGGEYSYTWYDSGNNVITDENDMPIDSETIQVSMAGIYKLVVKDENGCEGEATIAVEVWFSPVLEVTSPVKICNGSTFDLFDAIVEVSENAKVTYWRGIPGDGGSMLADEEAASVGAGYYCIVVIDKQTKCKIKKCLYVKEIECETEAQGCTLGYWKNHTDRWCSAYSTNTLFGSVFENAPESLAGLTLLEALNLGGGDIYNLARQGVAALLNACSGELEYEYDAATVISRVNDAYASGNAGVEATHLDDLNNAGCPLGGTSATNLTSETTNSLQGLDLAEANQFRAYPTPFTDKAVIEFTVAQNENFSMRLFDMRGALVRELKSGEAKAGLVNTVEVDGKGLPEGLYIARMVTDSGTKTVKLLKKE